MDPFTQKLLARTQARKDQLVKKREELEACRAKRNSPIKDRTRRPLSEDNTDSGTCEINTDEIKRRRIGSDDSGKSSALRNSRDIDVNSPSVQARKERLMKMQQKDQENGVTPKKHWKPALTQGAKDANSPSVASRSAAFENNMRDEQQENAKDKRLAELQSSQTPGKLAQTRSVFENTPEQSKPSITEDKFCPPPKPPRVAAIAEANMEHCQAVDQQQSTKRKAPSPPKEKDASNREVINDVKAVDGKTASVVKRRAPEPPTSPKNKDKIRKEANKSCDDTEYRQVEAKVKTTQSQSMSADKENEKSTAEPVPAKRERKGSIDGLDNATKSNVDQPTPTPRRKAQTSADGITEAENHNGPVKKPKRAQSDATVTIVATPIVGDEKRSKRVKSKQRPEEESCIIQARLIEENPAEVAAVSCENTVTVKGISSDGTERKGVKTHRSDRTKVQVSVVDPAEKQPKRANEKFSDGIISAVAQKPQSSRKTRQSTKKNDFEFKVPKQPVGPARDNCHFDLNETVNLNDVNIHEITFNFDFGQFDQELEQDRGSMFVSYEEKCKQLEKERKREEKKRKDSASASLNPKSSSGSSECDREERGSYKSGYNSSASDQYATKTVLKPKSAVPQRPKRTQDTIKMLLEEAAYQQNIVLQASQALNLCVANDITFRGSTEEIEAERVLLLASEHRTACLDEVQRLKNGCTGDSIPEFAGGSETSGVSSCTANLSLSGIKIILRQDFMDVLRVGIRSDLGVFYFLCIIQHGPHEFYCTKVLSTNDATDGNFLLFPDKFTLKDIKPNFNVTIKVFCMNVKKAIVSAPVTPSKTKLFQSPKVVKGMFTGRRTSDTPPATQVLPSPQTVFRTSSFSLVGVTHVNLPIIKSKRFSLDKVPDSCPLSTYLEMKAECIPLCSSHVKGFLTILEDIGGYGAWQRRWCVLEGAVMSYWRYPGDESIKPPLGSIDLSECISEEVTRVARDLCARPNTMELKLKRACGTEVKYLLAADTKTDRATWIDSLNEALRDGRAWTMTEDRPLYPDLSRLHNQDVYMCSKDTE